MVALNTATGGAAARVRNINTASSALDTIPDTARRPSTRVPHRVGVALIVAGDAVRASSISSRASPIAWRRRRGSF